MCALLVESILLCDCLIAHNDPHLNCPMNHTYASPLLVVLRYMKTCGYRCSRRLRFLLSLTHQWSWSAPSAFHFASDHDLFRIGSSCQFGKQCVQSILLIFKNHQTQCSLNVTHISVRIYYGSASYLSLRKS